MTESARIDAPITAVTVFTDGARVVRTGEAEVGPGGGAIVIGNLPVTADPASVRVAARGAGLALGGVEVARRFTAAPVRQDTARLQAEVERCRDAVRELDDEDAAEQARLTFLGHLSQAAATALARAVSFGRGGHDDLAGMGDHLAAGTHGALARRRDIAARRRVAVREMEAAEERLAAADDTAHHVVETVEVNAVIEASSATRAQVELSYHVSGASWRPLYDLVLHGETLAVTYLAEVTQRTGEGWPEVEVTLSTTRRGARQRLPELSPWYIGRAVPHVMPSGTAMLMSERTVENGPVPPMAAPAGLPGRAIAMAAAGAPRPEPSARVLTAEAGESGAGQSFRLPRPLAVPSDGDPHKATIAQFDLDAALDHLAIPVLAAEAYARATVTNDSPLLLLPGPARVFHDAQFAGQTVLPTVASGEELEVHLGVDDQIRVRRELRRRGTSKAAIGGSRTIDIAYEITVENHRPGTARVTVRDHIPVSTEGEIRVRLRETSPSPSEQTDLGELAWELTLAAGQSSAIQYRFTVEHPAQLTVAGL